MNTETLNALKQVSLQIQQLQGILGDNTLTPPLTNDEATVLEKALDDLEDLQDTLIHQTLQTMVDQINSSNADLQTILTKMQQTSDRLAQFAAGIKKVSDVVGTLAQIVSKGISAGLI